MSSVTDGTADYVSFNPDWVSPTGHSIKAIMEERGISRDYFIAAVGLTEEEADQLFDGKILVTQNMALSLSNLLGGSTDYWMRRDGIYIAECKRLGKEVPKFPYSYEMDSAQLSDMMSQFSESYAKGLRTGALVGIITGTVIGLLIGLMI